MVVRTFSSPVKLQFADFNSKIDTVTVQSDKDQREFKVKVPTANTNF